MWLLTAGIEHERPFCYLLIAHTIRYVVVTLLCSWRAGRQRKLLCTSSGAQAVDQEVHPASWPAGLEWTAQVYCLIQVISHQLGTVLRLVLSQTACCGCGGAIRMWQTLCAWWVSVVDSPLTVQVAPRFTVH